MSLYADDPDVHIVYPITDANQGELEFDPVVRVKGHDITAEWLGIPGPTRDLKVPLVGLAAGSTHRLRLVVPGDNDIMLGNVVLQ